MGIYGDHKKQRQSMHHSPSYSHCLPLSFFLLSFNYPNTLFSSPLKLSLFFLSLSISKFSQGVSIFQPRTIHHTQNLHPSWSILQGMLLKCSNSCMKQIKSTKLSKTHFMCKPNFSQNPINKIRSSGKFQKITYFSWITIIIARK